MREVALEKKLIQANALISEQSDKITELEALLSDIRLLMDKTGNVNDLMDLRASVEKRLQWRS